MVVQVFIGLVIHGAMAMCCDSEPVGTYRLSYSWGNVFQNHQLGLYSAEELKTEEDLEEEKAKEQVDLIFHYMPCLRCD